MTLSDWVPMALLSLFRTIYYDNIPNICTLTFSSEPKFYMQKKIAISIVFVL